MARARFDLACRSSFTHVVGWFVGFGGWIAGFGLFVTVNMLYNAVMFSNYWDNLSVVLWGRVSSFMEDSRGCRGLLTGFIYYLLPMVLTITIVLFRMK